LGVLNRIIGGQKVEDYFVVFTQGFVDRKNLIAAAAAGRLRGIIPAASFGGKKHFFF
jgi:hypothetical protein